MSGEILGSVKNKLGKKEYHGPGQGDLSFYDERDNLSVFLVFGLITEPDPGKNARDGEFSTGQEL